MIRFRKYSASFIAGWHQSVALSDSFRCFKVSVDRAIGGAFQRSRGRRNLRQCAGARTGSERQSSGPVAVDDTRVPQARL